MPSEASDDSEKVIVLNATISSQPWMLSISGVDGAGGWVLKLPPLFPFGGVWCLALLPEPSVLGFEPSQRQQLNLNK